jgi:hypothetical protein
MSTSSPDSRVSFSTVILSVLLSAVVAAVVSAALTLGISFLAGTPWEEPATLFEQHGSFNTRFGQEGEEHFPFPYASTPNVQLTGSRTTILVSGTPTGFKWKNSGNDRVDWASDAGTVRWVSNGVKGKAGS